MLHLLQRLRPLPQLLPGPWGTPGLPALGVCRNKGDGEHWKVQEQRRLRQEGWDGLGNIRVSGTHH